MKTPKRTLQPFSVLLIVFVLAIGCAEPPEPATALSAVTLEQHADLESTIARVRTLYFARDFHHGTAVGEAALERWPDSSELAAWTLANLSNSSAYWSVRAEQALARAELMVESRPDDVWSAIALAHAMSTVFERRGEALKPSLRALELAPTLPEAVWIHGYILHGQRQYQAAAAFIEEKWPVVDRQWPELLILKANAYLAMPDRVDEGLEILTQVREHNPNNINAHYLPGFALIRNPQRMEEGFDLLKQAAELSPGSLDITRYQWIATSINSDLDATEKLALIRTSAYELIEWHGNYPGIITFVAIEFNNLGRQAELIDLKAEGITLGNRVLEEFTYTEYAEGILYNRSTSLFFNFYYFGLVEDTVAARAELSSMWWSFINRPNHNKTTLLGEAYMSLFDHLRRDETVSGDTLLLLARGAAEHYLRLPHSQLASGLAERGVHLDEARKFAREGIDATEEHLAKYFYETPGRAANDLNRSLANAYSALGYVELKMGDLVTARDAIDRALALKPDNSWVQFRAGALAEAEGNIESAEIHYAWGEQMERFNPGEDKPNREALQRIYTARHGAVTSFEEYIVGIMARDRDRRWQRVADTRIAEPRKLPAIDLEWLDGGRIGADELKGRIVVINFWGVWCGPCVAEAPQIQQLHEKYRDDPDVVFLTINTFDPDLNKVRVWMADNKYDWPVLVDDNFSTPNGVRSYPTTWFADGDGRILFDYSGVSAAVFEEFVWRVEMLQAEVVAEISDTGE